MTDGAKKPRTSNILAVSEAMVRLVIFSVLVVTGTETWTVSVETSQCIPRAFGTELGVETSNSSVSVQESGVGIPQNSSATF